jgi:hypothetical protein
VRRPYALIAVVAVGLALAAAARPAEPAPVLRIIFPEGFSVRQMAEKVREYGYGDC